MDQVQLDSLISVQIEFVSRITNIWFKVLASIVVIFNKFVTKYNHEFLFISPCEIDMEEKLNSCLIPFIFSMPHISAELRWCLAYQ